MATAVRPPSPQSGLGVSSCFSGTLLTTLSGLPWQTLVLPEPDPPAETASRGSWIVACSTCNWDPDEPATVSFRWRAPSVAGAAVASPLAVVAAMEALGAPGPHAVKPA